MRKRLRYPRTTWTVLCSLVCVLLIGCNAAAVKTTPSTTSTTSRNEVPSPSGPDNVPTGGHGELPPTPKSPTLRIPLESVVATSQVAATKRQTNGNPDFVNAALRQIYGPEHFDGASNLFLVDAPTIEDAVRASALVFAGARAADVPLPLNMPDPPRGNNWLVVFLGIRGSSPTNWLVDSITVNGNVIRFSYHQQGSGAETANLHAYHYWVPLGKLDSGFYTLELYDTKQSMVTLMRRVEVKTPGQR
jgi:hypothetical protein